MYPICIETSKHNNYHHDTYGHIEFEYRISSVFLTKMDDKWYNNIIET